MRMNVWRRRPGLWAPPRCGSPGADADPHAGLVAALLGAAACDGWAELSARAGWRLPPQGSGTRLPADPQTLASRTKSPRAFSGPEPSRVVSARGTTREDGGAGSGRDLFCGAVVFPRREISEKAAARKSSGSPPVVGGVSCSRPLASSHLVDSWHHGRRSWFCCYSVAAGGSKSSACNRRHIRMGKKDRHCGSTPAQRFPNDSLARGPAALSDCLRRRLLPARA